jgi:hypothetical protein
VTSAAQIVNIALVPLRRATITSLTDGSPSANDANAIYAETLQRLLRRHDWNFARKRLKLAQEVGTPVSGFDYSYQLPPDFVRAIVVSDSDTGRRGIPYRLEQDSILSNASQIYLTYIYDVTSEAMMPPDFRDYLAYTLGVSLAKTKSMREEMKEERDRARTVAMSVDSIEDDVDFIPEDTWVTDRQL